MRRPLVVAVLAMAMLVPLACGSSSGTNDATRQTPAAAAAMLTEEGFPCRTLTVRAADGTTTTSCVWAATTPQLRERGLMGVADPSIGGRDAMAFTFPSASTAPFWMKDTLLPLTIAWVSPSGALLGTTDMVPCPTGTTCPTYAPPAPYSLAVEVARGRAPALGLVEGATVTLDGPCTAKA